jgi:hypothetical protein
MVALSAALAAPSVPTASSAPLQNLLECSFHDPILEEEEAWGPFRYVGCFIDLQNGRDMPFAGYLSDATYAAMDREGAVAAVLPCMLSCKGGVGTTGQINEGFRYFGVQAQRGCWCGNAYGSQGEDCSDPGGDCSAHHVPLTCDSTGTVTDPPVGIADKCGNQVTGCDDECCNRNAVYEIASDDAETIGSVRAVAQASVPDYALGCIDPAAANYNPVAVQNDESCVYECDSMTRGGADSAGTCHIYDDLAGQWKAAASGSPNTAGLAQLIVQGRPPVRAAATTATTGVNGPPPPPGGCDYEYIATPPRAWADAEQDCVNRGGHLASVHSANDWVKLTGLTTDTDYTNYWIGLNDREVSDLDQTSAQHTHARLEISLFRDRLEIPAVLTTLCGPSAVGAGLLRRLPDLAGGPTPLGCSALTICGQM